MSINKRYGDFLGDSLSVIQYAPRAFNENGALFVPKEDDDEAYFSRGWFRVINVKPSYDMATQEILLSCYMKDVEKSLLSAVYEITDKPKTKINVHKYSKLKITLFCIQHGIWQSVKQYLEEIGYYDLFVMAQYFLETDKYFENGIKMFKEHFSGQIKGDIDELIAQMMLFSEDGFETIDIPPELSFNDTGDQSADIDDILENGENESEGE